MCLFYPKGSLKDRCKMILVFWANLKLKPEKQQALLKTTARPTDVWVRYNWLPKSWEENLKDIRCEI